MISSNQRKRRDESVTKLRRKVGKYSRRKDGFFRRFPQYELLPIALARKMADFEYHVISSSVDEELSFHLILRAYDEWIYVSAHTEDLRSSSLKQYSKLAKAARHEIKINEGAEQDGPLEAGADAEGQETNGTKTASEDSSYASSDDNVLDDQERSAEEQLQEWIVEPLKDHLKDCSNRYDKDAKYNLLQWYGTDIDMFTIKTSREDKILAVRRRDIGENKFIQQNITPNMSLPQYLRKLTRIPWISPEDLEVVSSSDDIHMALHPTIVQKTGESSDEPPEKYFLKLVSPPAESSVKREIKILHRLLQSDLYSKGLRAPRLEGLVSTPSSPNSRAKILGFLLNLIPQPATPLTDMIDESVSSSKREAWAKKSEEMVSILHEHGITWGDAKADNFVVDKDEQLWIIDFGGSYTEGWVEPEVADTKEGDDMGTGKIVEAMKDPEGATSNPEEDDAQKDREEARGNKRKADDSPIEENKRQKL